MQLLFKMLLWLDVCMCCWCIFCRCVVVLCQKKAPVKNLLRVSSKSYTQAPTVNEIQPTIVSLLSNTSSKKIFGERLYDVYILHLRATRESLLCRTRDKKYLLSDKHKQKIIKRQGFLYNQILPISIKYFIRA